MKWLLLLLLLLSVSMAADPYLILTLDRNSVIIDSGDQANLTLTIKNPNEENIDVSISLLGEVNGWGTIADSELSIKAEKEKETTLYVGSPYTSEAGIYGMSITATGEINGSSISGSKSFSIRIRDDEFFNIGFTKDKSALKPGDKLNLEVEVENAGNVVHSTTLVTKIGDTVLDQRAVDLPPRQSEDLELSLAISNLISPGQSKLSVQLVNADQILAFKEGAVTIQEVSDLQSTDTAEKGFLKRSATYNLKNNGNIREIKEVSVEMSALERAFMASPYEPNSRDGRTLTWQVVLLPGEEETLEITTLGSALYILYLLILSVICLAAYLAYFNFITTPPIVLEKSIMGIQSSGNKTKLVVGVYIKNTSREPFINIRLSDPISQLCEVTKFESIAPDQINPRDGETEYIWNLQRMAPFEERAIIYHLETGPNFSINPATIHFQVGNRTYTKKTPDVEFV